MSSPISLQIPKFPLSCHTGTLPRVSHLPPNPSILHPRTSHYSNLRKTLVGAGHNQPTAAAAAAANSQISEASPLQTSTASDVVKEFYDGINRRDLAAVERLIGEDCVYEDLVFSQPFVGRKVAQAARGASLSSVNILDIRTVPRSSEFTQKKEDGKNPWRAQDLMYVWMQLLGSWPLLMFLRKS